LLFLAAGPVLAFSLSLSTVVVYKQGLLARLQYCHWRLAYALSWAVATSDSLLAMLFHSNKHASTYAQRELHTCSL
jgi:hypothetical protein